MTAINLKPPEAFDFSRPDDWPKWRKRFQQFRSASGLQAESETRQVDTLLYCLGEEADSILTSTNISEDDRKKYDKAMRNRLSVSRPRPRIPKQPASPPFWPR